MNYVIIYKKLIERAKIRKLAGYVERHHIIPKCIGGLNDNNNIAILTAREHFIAHLLLTKIYPTNPNIILAATMMSVSSRTNQRCNNRLYDWLRRKHAESMRILQKGSGNSQFGTCWISNINEQKCIKISTNEVPIWLESGWIKKRILDFNNYGRWGGKCVICNKIFEGHAIYCSKECKKYGRGAIKKSRFRDELENLCNDYKITNSVKATLLKFGFCGTGKHAVILMNELRNRNLAI